MFFTQEDYRKIEEYLKLKAKKDTDFLEFEGQLDENDIVTLVHEGRSYKIPLHLLVSTVVDKVAEIISPNFNDILELIDSLVVGGVALKQEFGDERYYGISQKKLTEAHEELQAQINTIAGRNAKVSLTTSASVFYVGEETFTLTAESDKEAESIVIKQGENVLATGTGTSLSYNAQVTQEEAANITYTAEFTLIGGVVKTANVTVYFVNKIYVGSGAIYTDVTIDSYAVSARRSPADTYNITVEQDGQYVFFVIPATMSINKATLSGLDFPLDAPIDETIDSVSYKVYRSSNTNDAGTYQIVIS